MPYLDSLGLKAHHFGYLGSAMALMGVLASIIGSKLYSKGKEKKFIISTVLLWSIVALSIIFVNKLVFVIIVLLGLGIISFPLVGLTVDLIGPKYTIFLAGLLAIPSLIIYYKIKDAPK